jgi:uncharacterized membrane protein YfcA
MSVALLIATSFSLGFFVESILGFGGGLIAYAILGFFIDLKEMILSGLYIGTLSSMYIAYGSRKYFDAKIFKSMIPLCIVGTIFGTFIFSKFSSEILSVIFGILLILLAIKTMFFDKFIFPKIFKNKLIFLGGVSCGSFGIGGPFWANALQKDFKNKSGLRATLAVAFVAFNFLRIAQLSLQNQLSLDFFYNIWWTILPVFIAIKLGHKVHLKISEDLFKKGIALITILAGIKFLTKAF